MNQFAERIKKLKDEIRSTPYHKGTQRHIGKLRGRIAQLEDELYSRGKSHGGGGQSFTTRKFGDATVVLLGLPSVGKSTLLNKLTNASSKVGDYSFTTTTVIPGIMNYQGAQIQILDLPGIIDKASLGRGHGKEILAAARAADLLIVMTDVSRLNQLKLINQELYASGIRLDKRPEVTIKKTTSGGLRIRLPLVHNNLDSQLVKDLAKEFKLVNAEIIIKEKLSLDQLIDALSTNRVYLPSINLVNKIDLIKDTSLETTKTSLTQSIIFVSADKEIGLEQLKRVIWQKLELIKIYLKKKEAAFDKKSPMILKRGATVKDLAKKISSDLAQNINGAKIWGLGASYQGQRIGKDQVLKDGQIVTLI